MAQPQPSPVYFGTIAQNPSAPQQSNFGGFDRLVSVDVEDYGLQRIWFPSGTPKDYLQIGDVVMLEYTGKKWKLSKQQTPELLAALQDRQPSPVTNGHHSPTASGPNRTPFDDDGPTPALTVLATTPPPATSPTNSTSQGRAEDCDLMVAIFNRLKRQLPEASEATVSRLACTVFIQITKREHQQ